MAVLVTYKLVGSGYSDTDMPPNAVKIVEVAVSTDSLGDTSVVIEYEYTHTQIIEQLD